MSDYGSDWTDEELKASLRAYLWMLEQEQQGKPYVKTEIRKQLLQDELKDRTDGSFEFRMRNISAVLIDLGLPYIKGYKPLANVGPRVTNKLRDLLEDVGFIDQSDFAPTSDPNELDKRTRKLRKRGLAHPPKGNKKPTSKTSTSKVYYRDPAVKAWVLERAKGICELCSKPAPFIDKNGQPFLEVHHVITLADGGKDTVENAVALCPNCHREAHYSKVNSNVITRIIKRVDRIIGE